MSGDVEVKNDASPSEPASAAWSEADAGQPLPFWKALRDDVLAHIPLDQRGGGRAAWAKRILGVVVRSAGFRLMLLYRTSHLFVHRAGPLGKLAAMFLYWWIRHFYGCSIAPTARLYGGIILPHPQGIVVGASAVVGPWGWIFQNVTIGGAPGKPGMPRVGIDARIYAGAVLTGPIRVGDHVMVGANAVVHRDVPDRTLVRIAPVEYLPLPPVYSS